MNDNSSMITVLCSHLCADDCRPLESSEWSELAGKMMLHELQPKDIPDCSDEDMKRYFGYGTNEIYRIKKLLDRAGSLGFELERLYSMGVKVITRADKDYPKKLKEKLKGKCPPLFYFAGNLSLLDRKTIGFVGSRTIGDEDTVFAEKTVEKINRYGFGVVSGGAKGVDSVAAGTSLKCGSFCIEYISDSLLRRIKRKDVISAIQNGEKLIMSMAKPDAGFNAGMAMQRNKFIYAQSEATVVIRSDYNKGGTWNGACEALKKKYCLVFCRKYDPYRGNIELIKQGAVPIYDDWNGDINNIVSDDGGQLSFF